MKKITVNGDNFDLASVREVSGLLREGAIVALPTETVYGLAAIYDNPDAVSRLYKIKRRPSGKPFTLCPGDSGKAKEKFGLLLPFGYRMIDRFWPGPLTLIFHGANSQDKIGIRVPSHKFTRAVLEELGSFVCMPSANISGEKESLSAQDVDSLFGSSIDLVVDGGSPQFSQNSTVVDLTYHPFKILREGVIASQELMEVFFKKRVVFVCSGNTCRSPMAEHMLKKRLEEKFPHVAARYEVISCGIIALENQPANHEATKVLREEEGFDMAIHRSRKIDRNLVLSSDLFFVMEEVHRKYILDLEPTAEARIFLLSKFLNPESEEGIIDPIGRDRSVYKKVYSIIDQAVEELISWL
ncbi:MAG: L-threonylcarbamoyladenylate synthase [Candidatus Omnitrophota bacterium]